MATDELKPEIKVALDCVINNSSGNIETFLDNIFAFLAKRTDFYLECPLEGGSYGFAKGHAECMVRSKFNKWQDYVSSKTLNSSTKVAVTSATQTKDCGTGSSAAIAVKIQPPSASTSALKTEECYNGRTTDKYSWSQTITDMDVTIPVNSDIKKGKQVFVMIDTNELKVVLAGIEEPLLSGKLVSPIKKDNSYWNLVPGEAVRIYLQKSPERWWQALLEGEELLDMSKIEAVRPMDDLGEEEQMKIQELCWNEEQKRQGLPTSEDLKIQNTLREAWNVQGSPFRGTPFDPSLVQINSGKDGRFAPFPMPKAD